MKNWDEFWLEKWESGKIAFHQDQVEPFLKEYFPSTEPGLVFVPLCGKSKDMLYFANLGHKVLGVELSLLACRNFFTENQIAFTAELIGEFTLFKSENITIYCGDFFKTPLHFLDGVSWVYDRASLIALPQELREQYARHMAELLKLTGKSVHVFLITLSYDESLKDGPPFSVTPEEVERLYGKTFEIKKILSDHDRTSMNTRNGVKDIDVTEHVFLLRSLSKN